MKIAQRKGLLIKSITSFLKKIKVWNEFSSLVLRPTVIFLNALPLEGIQIIIGREVSLHARLERTALSGETLTMQACTGRMDAKLQ